MWKWYFIVFALIGQNPALPPLGAGSIEDLSFQSEQECKDAMHSQTGQKQLQDFADQTAGLFHIPNVIVTVKCADHDINPAPSKPQQKAPEGDGI